MHVAGFSVILLWDIFLLVVYLHYLTGIFNFRFSFSLLINIHWHAFQIFWLMVDVFPHPDPLIFWKSTISILTHSLWREINCNLMIKYILEIIILINFYLIVFSR